MYNGGQPVGGGGCVGQIPLGPFCHLFLHLQLLLQGSFLQEEVK